MKTEPSRHGPAADLIIAARTIKGDQATLLKEFNACYEEDMCFLNFSRLAVATMLPRNRVRRFVRQLARKGLVVYGKGLWTEDGRPAGAGYACTKQGHIVALIISESGPSQETVEITKQSQ